jgi:hypothetical protein
MTILLALDDLRYLFQWCVLTMIEKKKEKELEDPSYKKFEDLTKDEIEIYDI